MSLMIESMESRTLLTVSVAAVENDLANLKIAGVTAKADLKIALIGISADIKTIKADVAATHPTPTQKAALTTLKKGESAAAAQYKGIITKILSAGFSDGNKLESVLKSFKAHPTSTVIQAKVQTALGKLQGVFSTTVVSTVETNAGTTVQGIDVDLNGVSAAVSSASSDVSLTETHLNTDLTTLSTDATAIQNAIASLANDLS